MSNLNVLKPYVFQVLIVTSALALAACGAGPAPKEVAGSKPVDDTPSITVAVNGGGSIIAGSSVVLKITTKVFTDIYLTSDSTCASGGTWDMVSATKTWPVADLNAVNTVYYIARKGTQKSECKSLTFVHDNTPPVFDIISPLPGAYANLSNVMAFAVGGTCTEASSATIRVAGPTIGTGYCVSGAWIMNLDLTLLPAGNNTLSFAAVDTVGNTSAAVTLAIIKDIVPPTMTLTNPIANGAYVNSTNQSSFVFSGACSDDGATVTISGDTVGTATCTSGAWSHSADLSLLPQGPVSVSIDYADLAGNIAESIDRELVKDSVLPTISIATPASNGAYVNNSNQSGYSVSGTCSEVGGSVEISGDAVGTASCVGGVWGYNVNFSAKADGPLSFTVTQADVAGNSISATRTLIKDIAAPVIAVTNPAANGAVVSIANVNSFPLSGTCSESGRSVNISGAVVTSTSCSGGTWSLNANLSAAAQGSININIAQSDAAGNSTSVVRSLVKDTIAPVLSMTTPATDGEYIRISNVGAYTFSGACSENGANVALSGSISTSVVCSSGVWSYTGNLVGLSEGAVTVTASHADSAGNSVSVVRSLIKDTMAPTIGIAQPATNGAYVNAGNMAAFTFSGSCSDSGSDVVLSGDVTATVSCASSVWTYSANLSAWSEGNLSITATHWDIAGNSTAVVRTLVKDSGIPSLAVSLPANGSYANLSNQASFSISGTCSENGRNVVITGDVGGSVACSSGTFSYNGDFTSLPQGAISIQFAHSDVAGNLATPVNSNFIKDTIAPTGNSFLINSGALVVGVMNVNLSFVSSGAAEMYITNTAGCGAGGSWESFSASKVWTLAQADQLNSVYVQFRDVAGNVTSCLSQSVTHSSTPLTLSFSTPVSNYINASNSANYSIGGSCSEEGQPVSVSGDASGSVLCTGGTWSFNLNLSARPDGSVSLTANHVRSGGSPAATPVTRVFTKDAIAPNSIAVTNPVVNPYMSGGNLSITGSCENDATVDLSGDDVQSTTCSAGSFGFTVIKGSDATYNVSINQTDLAGNISGSSVSQQWIRNSSGITPPTIASPAASPYYSNQNSVTLSGVCITGYTVAISGSVVAGDVTSPAGSLTQVCSSGAYSFTIAKASDSSYSFDVKQSYAGMDSAVTNKVWIRDTVAPNATIGANPTIDKNNATFALTSTETGTFECQTDGGAWTSCTASFVVANSSYGSRTINVRAIDNAGNVDATPATHSWTHYKTLGLYHLDGTPGTADSSLNAVTLTTSTITANTAANFSQGFSFNGTSSFATIPVNYTHNYMKHGFTFEGWIKLSSLPTTNGHQKIIASHCGASPNLGWIFALKLTSAGVYNLTFRTSTNGTAQTAVVSSANLPVAPVAGTWYHVAFTFDPSIASNNLKFYWGTAAGTLLGTKTVTWTAGNPQFISTATAIRLGRTQTMNTGTSAYFPGVMDEVRISEGVRTAGELSGGPYTVVNPGD